MRIPSHDTDCKDCGKGGYPHAERSTGNIVYLCVWCADRRNQEAFQSYLERGTIDGVAMVPDIMLPNNLK